jgi:adenine phosphoribosyltransferase
MEDLRNLIRTIPDFPKPGILFRDITTLLQNPWGFRQVVDEFIRHYRYKPVDVIVGIESRGFIIAGALAYELRCGIVLARKKGKLPYHVERQEYSLEYGTDCIEIHKDAITPGERVLIVDDLLATGGTCMATCQLVERLGGLVQGCGFVIDLPDLGGRRRLSEKFDVHTLVHFEGE